MSTQIEEARRGVITEEVQKVASKEGISARKLSRSVAKGRAVILKNKNREIEPVGVGKNLRTKINANIGTSPDFCDLNTELEKARVAVEYGADTIMDLSICGNLDEIRRAVLREAPVPLGTVPIYQVFIGKEISSISEDDFFNVVEKHAKDGVDFMTIHCGITRKTAEKLKKAKRVLGVVSRGGAFVLSWISQTGRENPFYSQFEYICDLVRDYDIVLSLGDGLRPGSVIDATDELQIGELITIGELVKKAREKGVQVIVEGPGHLPLHHIKLNVLLEKIICDEAPFYVLGPLVTDIAPGYDHITSAIGGAIAAANGADFLCYVTPTEHLGLPQVEDVKQGVIASRIAAHAADIAKYGKRAIKWDYEISRARAKLDWSRQFELSIDPKLSREIHMRIRPKNGTCSMCGKYCSIKLFSRQRNR